MSARSTWTGCTVARWIPTALFLALCLLPSTAPAERALPRKVLVLLNQTSPRAHMENMVRESCQTVLNYYGMLPEYRTLHEGPLPSDRAMSGFRGVITAFGGRPGPGPRRLSGLAESPDGGRPEGRRSGVPGSPAGRGSFLTEKSAPQRRLRKAGSSLRGRLHLGAKPPPLRGQGPVRRGVRTGLPGLSRSLRALRPADDRSTRLPERPADRPGRPRRAPLS